MNLISASRRTDIPHYFAKWFAERRKAGFAEFRNAFGGKGRVSLRNEDVLGYLFWTKYAHSFENPLQALRDEGIPYVFQYTITGYGHDLEPHIPRRENVIDDFIAIAKTLPSPECIQWRYDPIVISKDFPVKFHLAHFRQIASILEGATRVVNVSFPEPYAKTVLRMNDVVEVQYRQLNPRHKMVSTRYPNLPQVGQAAQILLDGLVSIAAEYLIELRMCSNPEWSDLPNSQCCSVALFAPYGKELVKKVNQLEPSPSRDGCRCIKTIDIGMDNTCVSGCRYCYAVQSQETAVRNFKQHDPQNTMLR
ncbi:MAG: hypothetical protein DRR19_30315 [Candidatus Parabeggiatoa sp. nov. 1]|nr:MAG: hypothetical protein DRR19_30315 [Gammaproteobacteria bacterium]